MGTPRRRCSRRTASSGGASSRWRRRCARADGTSISFRSNRWTRYGTKQKPPSVADGRRGGGVEPALRRQPVRHARRAGGDRELSGARVAAPRRRRAVPLQTDVLALRARGDREVWVIEGRREDGVADRAGRAVDEGGNGRSAVRAPQPPPRPAVCPFDDGGDPAARDVLGAAAPLERGP